MILPGERHHPSGETSDYAMMVQRQTVADVPDTVLNDLRGCVGVAKVTAASHNSLRSMKHARYHH